MAGRSTDLLDGNQPLDEVAVKFWEGLERNLNDNVMVSQRSILNLLHPDAYARLDSAMVCTGPTRSPLTARGCRGGIPS